MMQSNTYAGNKMDEANNLKSLSFNVGGVILYTAFLN